MKGRPLFEHAGKYPYALHRGAILRLFPGIGEFAGGMLGLESMQAPTTLAKAFCDAMQNVLQMTVLANSRAS